MQIHGTVASVKSDRTDEGDQQILDLRDRPAHDKFKMSLVISWLRQSLTLSSHLYSVTKADGICKQLLKMNGP